MPPIDHRARTPVHPRETGFEYTEMADDHLSMAAPTDRPGHSHHLVYRGCSGHPPTSFRPTRWHQTPAAMSTGEHLQAAGHTDRPARYDTTKTRVACHRATT